MSQSPKNKKCLKKKPIVIILKGDKYMFVIIPWIDFKKILLFIYFLRIQAEIKDNMHLAQAVTPRIHSSGGINSFDISINFEETTNKLKKLNERFI